MTDSEINTPHLHKLGITSGFYYEVPEAKSWKAFISCMTDIVGQITFRFQHDRIFICEYPESRSFLCFVDIPASESNHVYEIAGDAREFAVSLNMSPLSKTMNALETNYPFRLIFNNDDPVCLTIEVSDLSGDLVYRHTLATIDIALNPPQRIPLTYDITVDLPVEQFHGMVKGVTLNGTTLTVTTDSSDNMIFSSSEAEANKFTMTLKAIVEDLNLNLNAEVPVEDAEEEKKAIIKCDDDPCNEDILKALESRTFERPRKKPRFDIVERIEFSKIYSNKYLKNVARMASIIDIVRLVFYQKNENILFGMILDVPNFGKVMFSVQPSMLSEVDD